MNYRSIKTPEIFTKASDVELWLSRFRRYMIAIGLVREIEIVNTFSTLLDDECYRLVESVGFKPTWAENERTMMALFAKPTMNPLVYLQQFTSRTQRQDENVSQFAAALHDIANKSFHTPAYKRRYRQLYKRAIYSRFKRPADSRTAKI